MENFLLKGEKVLKETRPHPLSFFSIYIYFIYYILANGLILLYWDDVIKFLASTFIGSLGEAFIFGTAGLIWWIVNLIPALILSIVRISWRWIIIYSIMALALTVAVIYDLITVQNMFHIVTGISLIGILLVDVYRRSHRYIITNYRLVTIGGFMGAKIRDIFYNRITDVVLEQGILGKTFNFGTIIPLTAAGLGTGTDSASVTVGVGGAEKTPVGTVGAGLGVSGSKDVTVPRGRSSFVFFGVPEPDKIRSIILENIKNSIEAYKLDRIIDILEEKE